MLQVLWLQREVFQSTDDKELWLLLRSFAVLLVRLVMWFCGDLPKEGVKIVICKEAWTIQRRT